VIRPFEIEWWPNRVAFEVGAADRIRDVVKQLGRHRALIVCGRSVAAGAGFSRIYKALGDACAGAFSEIEMHSPLPALERGVRLAKETGADCIISIGGGSAIDSAKGIALIDTLGPAYRQFAMHTGDVQRSALPDLRLAHIAVPTTTGSGSEVAPTCGLRDPAVGHKIIFRDLKIVPSVAVLDPQMAVETPAVLTAASGMTAVARCVEALYSGRRNPFHSALALQALRMLSAALLRSVEAPTDLEARANCLVAASMSAIAANANVAAVHAIGHIIGGRYGSQHGFAHSILLAPTMGLFLPSIGAMQLQVLEALGPPPARISADEAGRKAAAIVADIVAGLPLPGRLRDLGVPEEDLPALAERASHDPIMAAAATPVTEETLYGLLQSAW
jgi:alcohol dehydrogenase class IV